ncbi:MAG: sulfatase-like hydrolase/transferase [Planctomycetes bacterium]|nr:sulfatase-like hydrolase/transferase [Planctomycetota bacterium]
MDTKPNKLENVNTGARFGLLDMLYFAIWFGVLSGLAEVALPQMNQLIGGRIVFLRSHTIWMSPLASIAVLGIVALAVLPLLLRLSRPMAVRIAFIILASVVFLNVLVLEFARLSQINFVAKVILAVGLAIALQRLIARRTFGFERFVRHTTIALVLLVLVVTVAISGYRHIKERGVVIALPESPPAAPNVLLVVLDTVRAESMSLYGYERQTTPYLKNLAEQGVDFQWAIATSSWTLPTHASLFTGRFHHETRTSSSSPLDAMYPTLAEVLTSRGYVTGGFVANNAFCRVEHGLARGFSHYEDYVASVRELARSSSLIRFTFGDACGATWIRRLLRYYERLDRKPAPRITKDFLRWIDRVPNGRPFFAFLNYFDAHQPYLPPADFARKFGHTDMLAKYLTRYDHKPCLASNTTAEEIESIQNAYDGSIAYLDYSLEQLFGELRQRDLLDQTLVVLVSDHGEEFGEHSIIGHGLGLHIQSIRVPLILRLPSIVPTDVTVQEPVTLRDIPATVINILGLADDGLFPGRSLSRYWNESKMEEPENNALVLSELSHAPWMKGTPIAKGDMKSLVIGDIHYIRNGDGTEEVYDLHEDPVERNDLIRMPRGEEAVVKARNIIEEILN